MAGGGDGGSRTGSVRAHEHDDKHDDHDENDGSDADKHEGFLS
jgi:hypothetical protein